MYWNAAGLSRIPRFSAGFTYTPYLAGIDYQAAEAAMRVKDYGTFAAGFRYMNEGVIDHTDLAGNSEGTFNPRDYLGEIGWGHTITDLSDNDIDVSMGVTAKAMHSQIIETANAYGADIGVLTHFFSGPFPYDFGFAAQNMGSAQHFATVKDSLPFRFKLGAALYPVHGLTLDIDAVLPQGNIAYGAAGVEYSIDGGQAVKVAFRAGINSQTVESGLNAGSMLSGGVGITLGDFSFDYSFTPVGVLGDVHRVSISWNIPAKVSTLARER